ncbi:alpha/beta fold hydrolase [Paraburkholderia sp. JHI869]|uniref:alpha/beta hydrolase n=1 Tax=Paraburkholderia sp. JHI869 TaxID=3112959 RepID=UPI00316B89A1
MYVQYQVPTDACHLPIILVHGGGGSGSVWETTPDGREGFQTLFLRRGHPVYVVDTPRSGRSGFPSFNGDFGQLDDTQQIVPAQTARHGLEQVWSRWRLGPRFPDHFDVQAFPMDAIEQFMCQVAPRIADDPDLVSMSLVALLERTGPAILVTHSMSGIPGWLTGARSPHVRAIISYEPSVVFPQGKLPPPIPLYLGTQKQGVEVTAREFDNLARFPIQIVYGDNIPTVPVPELPADGRRAQITSARLFAQAVNHNGGRAHVLLLPEAGLRGNSHFMFSDLNNVEVADQLTSFLFAHGINCVS